jgi:hypothetical protein
MSASLNLQKASTQSWLKLKIVSFIVKSVKGLAIPEQSLMNRL